MRVVYTEYLPDQPANLNEGLVTCDGVFAIQNGYAPIPSPISLPNGALGEQALGGGGYRVADDVYLFVATENEIKRYESSGYSNVGTGYLANNEVQVRFVPYNTFMLATNGTDPIQKFDPGTGSFVGLDASAPTARFLVVVRGFVVAGYTDDEGLQVAWSDSGAPGTWTPGTGDAGFAIMPSGGDVTGLVGGEYGLILQENRVVRMTATGDDLVWQFDEIATDVGCIAPKSVATYGRLTFFLSNKGWMVCDGVSVSGIGTEKIDRTFLSLIDRSYFKDMSAVVDPRNSLLLAAVPSASPTSSVFVYNFALQKWSTAPITNTLLFSALAQGVSLEDLDAIYTYLDTMPLSLDSSAFRGGYPLLLLFDQGNNLCSLSGPNLPALFTDGLKEMFSGQKARIRLVRPTTDAPQCYVSIGVANSLSDTLAPLDFSLPTTSGVYRTRASGNYAQVSVKIDGGTVWSYAQGYEIDAVPGGRA